jgi:hypothetical protein
VRTEEVFRQANEQIRQAAEEHALDMRVPFLCECADPGCSQVVLLSLDEHRAVRADATRFITRAGHESADRGVADVVGHHDGSVVVAVGAHAVR